MPTHANRISTAVPAARPAPAAFSRREFASLAVAAGTCLAAPVAWAAQDDDDRKRGWIDAHVHVWTPDTERYPLAEGYTVSDMQPPSFTPEQLFAHSEPAGVTRVVLIQMSFYGTDNRYMLDVIAQHPQTFSGVAIVDPQADDVA